MFKLIIALFLACISVDAMKRSFLQRVVATTVAIPLSFLPATAFAESNLTPSTFSVEKKEKFSIGKEFVYIHLILCSHNLILILSFNIDLKDPEFTKKKSSLLVSM